VTLGDWVLEGVSVGLGVELGLAVPLCVVEGDTLPLGVRARCNDIHLRWCRCRALCLR